MKEPRVYSTSSERVAPWLPIYAGVPVPEAFPHMKNSESLHVLCPSLTHRNREILPYSLQEYRERKSSPCRYDSID